MLTGKGLINRKVSVHRYINDGSNPIGNDSEFNGVVTDIWYDLENFQWVLTGEHLFQHLTVPGIVVTKEGYPEAPQDAHGSVVPLLYGAFIMSDTGSRADGAHGLNHVCPAVCIDSTLGKYAIASHAISSISTSDVAMYLDNLGAYGHGVHAWDGASRSYPSSTTTGMSYVSIPVPATNGIFRVENVWLLPKLRGVYNQFLTSSANAVDGDYNTDITIGASTRYAVKFGYSVLGEGGEFTVTAVSNDLQVYAMFIAHSGSNVSGGFYNPLIPTNYSPSSTSSLGYQTFSIGLPSAGKRSDSSGATIASNTQWIWEEIGRYEYYLSVPAASSLDISVLGLVAHDLIVSGKMTETIFYRQYLKRRRFLGISYPGTERARRVITRYETDPDVKETGLANIFCQAYGRKFGSWIGSRNGLSTSNVIVKSNYIIESILRDEMGVADADIDETAFDNDYSDAYTFAFSLTKQQSTQDVIEQLAYQSGCYCYRKSDGIWTLLRIPTTPSSSDVDFDYSLGDVKFTALYKSPHELITNEVKVLYNLDYATGHFTWDTSIDDTTSKGDTYLGTKATSTKEIAASFIRKDSDSGATNYAQALRDFVLSQWKDQHNIIEFECLNHSYFNAEDGDICTFNNVTTNFAGIGSGSSGDYWSSFADSRTKYWLIFSRIPDVDKVIYKAIQLHNL